MAFVRGRTRAHHDPHAGHTKRLKSRQREGGDREFSYRNDDCHWSVCRWLGLRRFNESGALVAPALTAGQTEDLWIYIAAPVVGAILAIPACRRTHGLQCCESKALGAYPVVSSGQSISPIIRDRHQNCRRFEAPEEQEAPRTRSRSRFAGKSGGTTRSGELDNFRLSPPPLAAQGPRRRIACRERLLDRFVDHSFGEFGRGSARLRLLAQIASRTLLLCRLSRVGVARRFRARPRFLFAPLGFLFYTPFSQFDRSHNENPLRRFVIPSGRTPYAGSDAC